MAASQAESAGATPDQICRAPTWSSYTTFVKHYRVDLVSAGLWAKGSASRSPALIGKCSMILSIVAVLKDEKGKMELHLPVTSFPVVYQDSPGYPPEVLEGLFKSRNIV